MKIRTVSVFKGMKISHNFNSVSTDFGLVADLDEDEDENEVMQKLTKIINSKIQDEMVEDFEGLQNITS